MRWLFWLAVLGGLSYMAVRDVKRQLFEPLPIASRQVVEVPRGASFGNLLREWQGRGIIGSARQRLYLALYARSNGEAGNIKAGEYEFVPGMRAIDLSALLVSGHGILHELRLTEGMTFAEALELIRHDDRLAHAQGPADPAAIMKSLGREGLFPEGRFYPDTYSFPRGTPELAYLRRALETMDSVLAQEWAARDPDLSYASPDEALIMASIVEKETGAPSERPEIAGVFLRRLEKHMRLQTDPTVIYGLGPTFDGNLRKKDLTTDTPYNTYTRAGLPPTPICLPGRAAIHAALHPARGNALYFVARKDGTHQFSATLAEHQNAVRKYQLRRSQ